MSKIALDLKSFKHVKSDDKATTLKHKDGHTLTLEHKKLSPKYREQLEMLAKSKPTPHMSPNISEAGSPMSAAEGGRIKMAEGGGSYYGDPKDLGPSVDRSRTPPSKPEDVKEQQKNESDFSHGWQNVKSQLGFEKGGEVKSEESKEKEHKEHMDKKYSERDENHKKFMENHDKIMNMQPKKMADGGAADMPCQNPNCKSHGQSHPNCKCYGGFAKGGQVMTACEAGSHHHPACEYYSDDENPSLEQSKKMPPKPVMYGNPSLKMYADPQEPVSQDDAAPEMVAQNDQEPPQEESNAPVQQDAPETTQQLAQLPAKKQQEDAFKAWHKTPDPAVNPADQQQPQDPTTQSIENAQRNSQAPMATGMMPSMPQEIAKDPVMAKAYTDEYNSLKQKYAQESVHFGNDMANGHITPMTYHQLFANKGTLGKIGTLFGLIVGGAGSGLTGQPNVAFQMMDNEISRDLQAQEKSKDNALNYLRANQNNYVVSQNQMLQATMHKLKTDIDNYGDKDPRKAKAQDIYGQLWSQVGDKMSNAIDQAAGAEAFNNLAFGRANGNATPGSSANAGVADRAAKLRIMGNKKSNAAADILQQQTLPYPEVAGQIAYKPVAPGDADNLKKMKIVDDSGKDLYNFAQKYKGMILNPNLSIAQKTDLYQKGQEKTDEMLQFLNGSFDGGQLTADRYNFYKKQLTEDPTSVWQDFIGKNGRLNEVIDRNRSRMEQTYHEYGLKPKWNRADLQAVAKSSPMINVVSPDGKMGTIPSDQLQKALNLGYKRK